LKTLAILNTGLFENFSNIKHWIVLRTLAILNSGLFWEFKQC